MEDEDFFEEPESINRLGCQSDMVAVEELDPSTISDSDQVLDVHEVFANDKELEDSSNITPESVQFEIDWTTPVCPPPPPFFILLIFFQTEGPLIGPFPHSQSSATEPLPARYADARPPCHRRS
jgi:hypothetical protein